MAKEKEIKEIEVKSVMRSYRIKTKLANALNDPKINKNKLVNEAIEKELKARGIL